MSQLSIEPLSAKNVGALVTGIDLVSLKNDEWQAILEAFHEYGLLVFPGQHLSDEDQGAFGRRFGELEVIVEGHSAVPLSNKTKDGDVVDKDDPIMQVLLGNEGWHTDSSYMPISAKASVLSAHVLPTSGGGTEWADMRAAYEALPEGLQETIQDLAAFHSLKYSQARAGMTQSKGYGYDVEEPPLRPLVKFHPVTGKPALYIGRHAHGIPGLENAESEALLDRLLSFACSPERCHEHHWQVGDLIIWDNRRMLHRARPYDIQQARVMKHTRISGDVRTESGMQTSA